MTINNLAKITFNSVVVFITVKVYASQNLPQFP